MHKLLTIKLLDENLPCSGPGKRVEAAIILAQWYRYTTQPEGPAQTRRFSLSLDSL
jgi:hypothetical protein